jgi:hypothetical protein
MSYVDWKIEHIPFRNNTWDDDDKTEITRFFNPLLSQTLGDGKDTFQFDTTNFNDEYNNFFNPLDKITIYRVANGLTHTTDDIIMVGTIKDVPTEEDGTRNTLKIKGYNFSESVMSAIIFLEVANLSVPDAIKAALANAGGKNENFKVEWHPDNDTVISGLTFPTIVSEKFFNKPLRKVVEKYSTSQKTENGSFFWYVDNNNYFVWRPQNTSSEYSFDYNTDECKRIKLSKDVKGVKNYIIIRGGFTPNGTGIQTRYVAQSSVSKHGQKFYFFVSEKNLAQNLVKDDIIKSYGNVEQSTSYPDLSTSFTTSWVAFDSYNVKNTSISTTEGSPVTINEGSEEANQKAYNELLKIEITKRIYEEAFKFAENNQFGKLLVELQFRAGTKEWQLGDRVNCTLPQLSSDIKQLRVKEIQKSTKSDIYTLEEDEGSL